MKVQVINTGKTEGKADLTGRGEEGESHYEFSWGHTRFETTKEWCQVGHLINGVEAQKRYIRISHLDTYIWELFAH